MSKENNAEFKGFKIPLDNLDVVFSILSIICFGLTFYFYFFLYSPNKDNNFLIATITLFIVAVSLAGLGFPKWIEENREERDIRKKRRELEKEEINSKKENIKRKNQSCVGISR